MCRFSMSYKYVLGDGMNFRAHRASGHLNFILYVLPFKASHSDSNGNQ